MAVLMLGHLHYVGHLHYDWHQPDLPANHHLIFSKGQPRRCCTRCFGLPASSTRTS